MQSAALSATRAVVSNASSSTTVAASSSSSSSLSSPFLRSPPPLQLVPGTCPLLAQSPFAARSGERLRSLVSTAAMAKESEGPSYFGGVDESALESAQRTGGGVACRLVALVPSASSSPNSPVAKGEASWLDVMLHEAVKIRWSDPRLELKVVEVPEDGGVDGAAFDAAVANADALFAVAFGSFSSSSSSAAAAAALSLLSRPSAAAVRTLVPLGCEGTGGSERLLQLARINGVSVFATTTTTTTTTTTKPENNNTSSSSLPPRPLLARLPAFFSAARRAFDAFDAALSFWSRAHSDDALTALLVVADATGKVTNPPLAALDSLRGQGIGTLLCMLRNCRHEVVSCVTDQGCKQALDCLTAAPPGDQVAAYRCIVSHESRLFEDFSLCVLTKNRCLGVSAEPPRFPQPRPQKGWRGREMTHEAAEALFVGWREKRGGGGGGGEFGGGGGGGAEVAAAKAKAEASAGAGTPSDSDDEDSAVEPWSWRVCAGQNPAYDQFNCQYQIFYRGRGKGVLWYVPVFNVETLGESASGSDEKGGGDGGGGGSGKRVWRRRKYRVKRGERPGTFWFSVLDNGVVSKEFWTIVSVPDDLGYALFSYNGAASAAGQAYSGSVLCTRDGAWPDPERYGAQLDAALNEAGVKTWELFRVNNDSCEGAPLEIEEG